MDSPVWAHAPPQGIELRRIAKKILNRNENDSTAIPFSFLNLLLVHLIQYPEEQHFLADLDQPGGEVKVTCLDCWFEIVLGAPGDAKTRLKPFWDHIQSRQHISSAMSRSENSACKNKELAAMDFASEWLASEQPSKSPEPQARTSTLRSNTPSRAGSISRASSDGGALPSLSPRPFTPPKIHHYPERNPGPQLQRSMASGGSASPRPRHDMSNGYPGYGSRSSSPVKVGQSLTPSRISAPSTGRTPHRLEARGLARPPQTPKAKDIDMVDITQSSPEQTISNVPSSKEKKKKILVFPDGEEVEFDAENSEEDVIMPLASTSAAPLQAATATAASLRLPQRKRVKKTVYLDGEPFEYETSEEEELSVMSASVRSGPPPPSRASTSASSSSSAASSSAASSSRYISPFSRFSDESPTRATTPNMSAPDVSRTSSGAIASSSKRPQRPQRRYQFDDGEVIYISTDDESVDQRGEDLKRTKPNPVQDTTAPQPSYSGAGVISNIASHVGAAAQTALNGALNAVHGGVARGLQNLQTAPYPGQPPPLQFANAPVGAPPRRLGWNHRPFPARIPGGMPGTFPAGSGLPGGSRPNKGGALGAQSPIKAKTPHTPGYINRPNAGTFNLNYDDMTNDLSLERGGLDHSEKMRNFLEEAMELFQDTPSIVAAANSLGLATTNDLLPGMEVKLLPHQLIGVNWMAKQEAGSVKGGILADDMGLGKTIQGLAICVQNQPPADSPNKGILIVAPAALLDQWKREFTERTTEGLFRVHIHHGSNKLRTEAEVRKYDVIITTYQTLSGCFAKDKKKKKADLLAPPGDDSDSDSESDSDSFRGAPKRIGPLAKTKWWRVMLDEAQCIRNRRTRTSRTVASLDATYRWALSGTPVTNNLADLYGFVRFLQFSPFNNWKEYNLKIAKVQKKNPTLAGHRSQAMLKKCLLRRTKHSQVEGRPILTLPTKSVELIEVEFTSEERKVYEAVEERQKQKMSKFVKEGTVMKNYAFILVMILRLRQACNHPSLLFHDKDHLTDHEVSELGGVVEGEDGRGAGPRQRVDAATRARDAEGAQFVDDLKTRARTEAEARIKADINGVEEGMMDNECPICLDQYVDENCILTQCKHKFCQECLDDYFTNPPTGLDAQDATYGQMMDTGERPCPVCRERIHPRRVYAAQAFEPTPLELEHLRRVLQRAPGQGADDLEAGFVDDWGDVIITDLEFEPSSKMHAMMKLIRSWMAETEDKFILYSQWTSMLNLIEKMLLKERFDFLRFDGKMSREARDDAVTRFKKRRGPRIMLISLKAGGVGLNLTEANRVISLDLAWNAATENQAFDRVHRMGQQKEVEIKRVIVRNTIEERIINLQTDKQALADAALGEGKVPKLKKMSVQELKYLFGM